MAAADPGGGQTEAAECVGACGIDLFHPGPYGLYDRVLIADPASYGHHLQVQKDRHVVDLACGGQSQAVQGRCREGIPPVIALKENTSVQGFCIRVYR